MIRNDLYTSYGNSKLKVTVFDDDSFHSYRNDTSNMLRRELFKYVNSHYDYHLYIDRNLFLKLYITHQDHQKFNPFTNFLSYLIYLTLVLFVTCQRHLLTSQIPLRIPTNHMLPIEIIKPNKVNHQNRHKKIAVPSIASLSGRKIIFRKLELEKVVHRNFVETSTLATFFFMVYCNFCASILNLRYLFWKEIQSTEIEEISPNNETENFGPTITVV